jgi:hypothetical protein
MSTGENYRAKAAEFDARARREIDPFMRKQWDGMAKSYRRLAEQADRNAQLDLVYEPPAPRPPMQQQQQQQQQQVQPGTQNPPSEDDLRKKQP